MASPFSIFRKRQKLMMAILCLLAMVSFVLLPNIQQIVGGGSGANKVAVKSSYGNLTERELGMLRQRQQRVLSVLTIVCQGAGVPASVARQRVEMLVGSPSEQSVVDRWLLARHAEKMGVIISNKTIVEFLQALTQNRVKRDEFQAAFRQAQLSESQFFDAMRDVLAALDLENMFQVSMIGITPAQRWEYFSRVKQMAAIEAVPVPVANYVSRIADPSDAELKAFFEEYKEKYPVPDSPDPGFREPQKVALQYFRADFDKFTAATAVTDQEVQQRYEANREMYDQAAAKAEGAKEEKASTKDSKGTKEEAGKGAEKNKPAENKAPAAKEPAPSKPAPAAKQPEKPKEPEQTKKPEEPKKAKGTSAVERRSPFALTGMLADEKVTGKPATGASAPKPEAKPEAAKQPAKPEVKPEAKPATPPAAPPAPAKEQAKPAEKPAAPAPAKPAETKPALAEATKTRIRQEIAYEKIQKVFQRLREQMEIYSSQYRRYKAEAIHAQNQKGDKPLAPPPARPDFEKLAKENGLTAGRTELMTQWQAQASEIGSSLVGGRDPVWHYAFQTLPEFRPEISGDFKGNLYLLWKTSETKDRVPKFEDQGVRQQVLQAWKLIKARSLATKEAETLAAEAQKSKKSLKQLFTDRPDLRVIMPPPFSWITFGNVPLGSAPEAARISNVIGVDYAGEQFMQTVFHLTPGQTGVAMNAPQMVAYVIQLKDLTPSHEVLWKQFEVDDFSKYAPAARSDQQKLVQAWLTEIKKSSGFAWAADRKPMEAREGIPRDEED
jgi:hypothetical protein